MTQAPRRVVPKDDLPREVRELIKVFVDGDMPRGVLGYDMDEGWAVLCEFDDAGDPIRIGEFYKTRIVTGKIRAVIEE